MSDNLVNIEDNEELLDNEFRENNKREVDDVVKEDYKMRGCMNTFSDIRAYLESNGLVDEIFHNISIDFIKDNMF